MVTHYIHRGLAKKKLEENTLAAFKYSFKKGYGIETDIHCTKAVSYTHLTLPTNREV